MQAVTSLFTGGELAVGGGSKINRLHAMDALRATMMYLGVVYHALQMVYGQSSASQSGVVHYLQAFLHSFRMPVFFIIAGFFSALLLAYRGRDYFLANRFQRIFIPTVAALILIMPLNYYLIYLHSWVSQHGWGGFVTLIDAADGALTRFERKPKPHHLWFLLNLVFYYVCFLAVLEPIRFLRRKCRCKMRFWEAGLRAATWLVIPLALGGLMVGMKHPDLVNSPNRFYLPWRPLSYYGLYFLFGALVFHFFSRDQAFFQKETRLNRPSFFLLGGVVLIGLAGLGILPDNARAICYGLGAWTLSAGIVFVFNGRPWKSTRSIRYLADSSYWVYLIHEPLLHFLDSLLIAGPLRSAHSLRLVIALAATTALSLLSYDTMVRYTFLGRFLNGKKKKPASTALTEPARP